MEENGYTAIPKVDYKPYTELPPDEREQVEEYIKEMNKRRKAAEKIRKMQSDFKKEINSELERKCK